MRVGARSWIEFILKNFATPIAFYFTFKFWGSKPAIALAVLTTLVQLLVHRLFHWSVTPFFLVASGFTVFFGAIDLMIAAPRFFRLQPAVQNFILGAAFSVTLIARIPVAVWFAQALPAGVRPTLGPKDEEHAYLRKVTLVWTIYFFAKAGLFLYLAFTVDLGELVVLRSAIGGSSLLLMFGGEIAYRKMYRDRRRRKGNG